MNFSVDFVTLVTVAAGISAIYGAWKIVKKPAEDMNLRLKKYDEMLANDKKRLDEMQKLIESISNDLNMTADMTYQILDHMSTNNNTGGMKDTLDKYNAYFRKK